jgi:hypothetical protein
LNDHGLKESKKEIFRKKKKNAIYLKINYSYRFKRENKKFEQQKNEMTEAQARR